MKKAVMYGAGNIGRGFIGKIFSESGYEVCFIDIDEKIIEQLNTDNQYPVNIVSNDYNREVIVKNVKAVNGMDTQAVAEVISQADIMATAVGVNVLPYIVNNICEGIKLRKEGSKPPLNIIICENLIGADKYLKKLLIDAIDEKYIPYIDENLGLVIASVGRMVPVMTKEMKNGNNLRIIVEPYEKLPIDKDSIVGEMPKLNKLIPFSPFDYYIKRKLFMHNMAHALCAYLGYLKGYEYIYECVNDNKINDAAKSAMLDVAEALNIEYGVSMSELEEHVDDLLERFGNIALQDTVNRVGKDPIRKLKAGDRLVGAAIYCSDANMPARGIVKGIAAGLMFDNPNDEKALEVQELIKEHGIHKAIKKICELKQGRLLDAIANEYNVMRGCPEIIAAGHICLDIMPKFENVTTADLDEIFIPGRLINMNGIAFNAGGAVANTGFAMSKLGLNVMPIGNIGDDELGKILNNIAKSATGKYIKTNNEINTSYSVVLSIGDIDRIILHDPSGNNIFKSSQIDYDELYNSRLFHFGYPPLMKSMFSNGGSELVEIYKRAKQMNITTSLDMSLPDVDSESGKVDWQDILTKVLPYVDIFMPSIEEALFMLEREEYDRVREIADDDDFTKYIDFEMVCELGSRILELKSNIVMIKCGANGIYLKTGSKERLDKMGRGMPMDTAAFADKELFRETYVVQDFKSALAGGDTTIAGFLSALLKGFDIYDCVKIACKTGALCCESYDSISSLLPIEDIYQLTKTKPARNICKILGDGFIFDEETLVWIHKQPIITFQGH